MAGAVSSSTQTPAPRRHWDFHRSLSRRGRLIATAFLVIAAGLVPWTIGLALTLPPKYHAGHWDLLWVGFDAALIAVLALASWAAWFGRQILAAVSLVAGTLLLCDAWFDIITSIGHRDEWVTLLTGLGGEIPLALFFFWLYRRIVLNTLAVVHEELDDGPAPRRLREAELLFLPHGADGSHGADGPHGVDEPHGAEKPHEPPPHRPRSDKR